MKFETARVRVMRALPQEQTLELHNLDDPQQPPQRLELPPAFEYEVVAWPPGEIDGNLLPQTGDQLTLPGYDLPFRVRDRVIHWPAPSSPEAARGEVAVDLLVDRAQAEWTRPPWERPGADDDKWFAAQVVHFETRPLRHAEQAGRQFMRVMFRLETQAFGQLPLPRLVRTCGAAAEMFPTQFGSEPPYRTVDQARLAAQLRLGQRFEVRLDRGWKDRVEIFEVRPVPGPHDPLSQFEAETQSVLADPDRAAALRDCLEIEGEQP